MKKSQFSKVEKKSKKIRILKFSENDLDPPGEFYSNFCYPHQQQMTQYPKIIC